MHRRSLNTLQWIVASLLLAILVGLCVAYLTPTASTDQQNSKAATPSVSVTGYIVDELRYEPRNFQRESG